MVENAAEQAAGRFKRIGHRPECKRLEAVAEARAAAVAAEFELEPLFGAQV